MTSNKINFSIILICIFILGLRAQSPVCHYTCTTCKTSAYYDCTKCLPNRGLESSQQTPFAGMCYCSEQTDQSSSGQCTYSSEFNHNNKALIASLIGLSLFFSFLMMITRGFRYYFVKVIEDVQQLSLVVFINLYFPQQFDIFMTKLYRFNISSLLFETMASGSLFVVENELGVVSTDGTNVYGKYRLLNKTANFFSNMFTWVVVFVILVVVLVVFKLFTRKLTQQQTQNIKVSEQRASHMLSISQSSINNLPNNQSLIISDNMSELIQQSPEKQEIIKQKFQIKRIKRNTNEYNLKNFVIKISNIMSFNVLIVFFYLSLVQINVNIFTQFGHFTFSTAFGSVGAISAILFLVAQLAVLGYLLVVYREQLAKPHQLYDYSFSAVHYLIRKNFKSLTKYFFFYSSLKKIMFALIIVVFYNSPSDAILGFSILQVIFLCFSIYLQPFEKRYLRLHFYVCETLKMFFFISLINFVQKYKEFAKLIQITQTLFSILVGIFAFHLTAILFTLLIEFQVYWHEIKRKIKQLKKCCVKENYEKQNSKDRKSEEAVIGYFNYLNDEKGHEPTESSSQKNNKILNEHEEQKMKVQKLEENIQSQQQEKDHIKKCFYIYKQIS